MLFRSLRGWNADLQVIIESGANDLGMYNNSGGYVSDNFDVSTIPNYSTAFNCLFWRLSGSSPYYRFGYNNTLDAGVDITDSGAALKNGFGCIGAYHNGSTDPNNSDQYWGKIAMVLYYNRALSDTEILQNYLCFRSRYGI